MTAVQENELPHGWTVRRIAEVAAVNPKVNKKEIPDDLLVSFVPMPAVGADDGSIDVSEQRPFAEVKKGYTGFAEGDVLFAKITPCMENGKMAVVPPVANGYGFGSTEFHVLRPNDEIEGKYLYYYVSSKQFRGEAERHMTGAVGQRRVPAPYLKYCLIPIAPPEQQRSIVAEIEKQFSRLDEAVTNLKRVKANLKRYKAAVLKAAVEGKLTEEWRKAHPDVEPTSKLLDRILAERRAKWEEAELAKMEAKGKAPKNDKWKAKYKEPEEPDAASLDDLPRNWIWTSLSHVCTQIADIDHKMPKAFAGGIPYVSTKDFRGDNKIDFAGAKKISPEDFNSLCRKVRPTRGDVLLSRYGTVGEVRVVDTDIPFQASYSVAIIKPVVGFGLAGYLDVAMKSEVIQSQIRRDVRATAQPDLGLAHIREFAVPFPPREEQSQIIAEVDCNFSLIRETEAQVDANLKRAERLRQAILSRAFSGDFLDASVMAGDRVEQGGRQCG